MERLYDISLHLMLIDYILTRVFRTEGLIIHLEEWTVDDGDKELCRGAGV